MDPIAIVDILILAGLAGFILFRLWSVLGTRTGQERPAERPESAARPGIPPVPANDKATVTPIRPAQSYPAAAARGLADIEAAYPAFNAEDFLNGAAAAHERVLQAFADGDREELRMLLDTDIFAAFDAAITEREAKGWTTSAVMVKQNAPQIMWAALKGRSAEIGLRYENEIIQFSKNAAGEIVDGSDTVVKLVVDRWTWAHDVKSPDPNWKLEDAESGD